MNRPNKKLGMKLGAAYKKGYPKTYLKTQTQPIFRKTISGQEKEVQRFMAVTGLPRRYSINLLKNKYKKSKIKFRVKE